MRTQLFSYASSTNFFCFTLSLHWWYSILRMVWFGQLLNPMKKTFFMILFSRNSKGSVLNTNFFPDKVTQFFCFTLSLNWLYSIPRLVWCRQLLARWKGVIFKILKKTPNSRNSQNCVWKPIFFPRQAIPTNFLLCTLITLVILHTEFG